MLAPLAARPASPITLEAAAVSAALGSPPPALFPASCGHGTPTRKLTPLEKKARDKVRKREQAARRLQRLRERDDAALQLQQAKALSSVWHEKEREEEELVLRCLERDAVYPQKMHPAAAGYEFHLCRPTTTAGDQGGAAATVASAANCSPVFRSYSHARCPPLQAPTLLHRSFFGAVQPEAAYRHPACQGYVMARDNDSSRVSPVFFLSDFAKIPLERVVLETDDDSDDSMSDYELGGQDDSVVPHVLTKSEREELHALMAARFQPSTPDGAPRICLICRATSPPTVGCPGCFTFSPERHHDVTSSHAAQRLKTPKTRVQEQEERVERHRALQRQLIMPAIHRKPQPQQHTDSLEATSVPDTTQANGVDEYYMHVLADHQAIRKHRAIMNDYVTLHIKTLPAGSILSLRIDTKSSVAYVYELYRAHTELPNRPIHLLLPTAHGLFYLDERIEAATDVRNGLVNGELDLQDFRLHTSRAASGDASWRHRSANAATRHREFMLFSVAVLNDNSTPQLVGQYLQQNFRLSSPELASPERLAIHRAAKALPPTVSDDACQRTLLPHVQRMQAFSDTNRQLALAEQQRERDALVRAAFFEARAAKLAQRKQQRQLEQQRGKPSAKVRRALAFFAYVLETTSHAAAPRLAKLFQCFQLLEEWKLCKAGKLLDAETTDATLALLKAHQDATASAFDSVLDRSPGPLVYPMLWLSGTRKLVVKLGTRLGASVADDRAYGLLLDLDQDFDALARATAPVDVDKRRMAKRGFTKRALATLATEQDRELADALARSNDVEWRPAKEPPALFTSADLLRPPFYQLHWLRIAQAYKLAMRAVATYVAKLDEYNALARVLQRDDAVMSKAQIAKWQSDAEAFVAVLVPTAEDASPATPTLKATSCLAQAARRVLVKKGAALLKTRARQRKKQLREREAELERLQQLQAERDLPKLSLAQQMKLAFVRDKAPAMRAALELTPAEKLSLKASQLIGKVAASASSVAAAAKKEYKVRAL